MIEYKDTTALVTGAASGIGRALAGALAARGAFVVLADLNKAPARRGGCKRIGCAHSR